MHMHLGGWCATVITSALVLGACARHHGEEANSAAASAADGGSETDAAASPTPPIEQAAHVGAKASVTLDALAGGAISGEGTFTETEQGVDLELRVRGCANVNNAKPLPVVIMQGGDCSQESLAGGRYWDRPRGEDIPAVTCTGTSGAGRVYYSRPKSDAKSWTVGTPEDSNVIGHAFVIFEPETLTPGACGVIGREPDKLRVAPAANSASGPSEMARAVVDGLCLGRMLVRDNAQECPNPKELNACAAMHCDVDACLQTCADYTACLDQQMKAGNDICQASLVQCPITQACASCSGGISQCVFGFCSDQVACASPITPNGPCAKLEACCNQQGDADASQCLETVHLLEKLSGDPSCYGVMRDWDTTAHLKVPCMFQ